MTEASSADRSPRRVRVFSRHDVTNGCRVAPYQSCGVHFPDISSSPCACFLGVQSRRSAFPSPPGREEDKRGGRYVLVPAKVFRLTRPVALPW